MIIRLRRYIVAGLLVWLPVGATILVFTLLLDLMDRLLVLIPPPYRPEALLGFRIPGLGAILALVVLIVTGFLVANLLGRRLVTSYESLLGRIPLVRTVYGAVKHFAEMVFSDSSTSFKKVLLIEYPREGLYSLCFQTSDNPPEVQNRTGDTIVTVLPVLTKDAEGETWMEIPESAGYETVRAPMAALMGRMPKGASSRPRRYSTRAKPCQAGRLGTSSKRPSGCRKGPGTAKPQAQGASPRACAAAFRSAKIASKAGSGAPCGSVERWPLARTSPSGVPRAQPSLVPPTSWNAWADQPAILSRKPVATSSGNRINNTIRLKKSCTVAAANARLYSFDLVMCPRDTIVFVTVVPTFAPITMNTAEWNWITPPATMVTTKDVVVDEL